MNLTYFVENPTAVVPTELCSPPVYFFLLYMYLTVYYCGADVPTVLGSP